MQQSALAVSVPYGRAIIDVHNKAGTQDQNVIFVSRRSYILLVKLNFAKIGGYLRQKWFGIQDQLKVMTAESVQANPNIMVRKPLTI